MVPLLMRKKCRMAFLELWRQGIELPLECLKVNSGKEFFLINIKIGSSIWHEPNSKGKVYGYWVENSPFLFLFGAGVHSAIWVWRIYQSQVVMRLWDWMRDWGGPKSLHESTVAQFLISQSVIWSFFPLFIGTQVLRSNNFID